LLDAYGTSLPISIYVAATCVVTFIAVYVAKETRGTSLADPDREPSVAA
jgi:hypothetical protein